MGFLLSSSHGLSPARPGQIHTWCNLPCSWGPWIDRLPRDALLDPPSASALRPAHRRVIVAVVHGRTRTRRLHVSRPCRGYYLRLMSRDISSTPWRLRRAQGAPQSGAKKARSSSAEARCPAETPIHTAWDRYVDEAASHLISATRWSAMQAFLAIDAERGLPCRRTQSSGGHSVRHLPGHPRSRLT